MTVKEFINNLMDNCESVDDEVEFNIGVRDWDNNFIGANEEKYIDIDKNTYLKSPVINLAVEVDPDDYLEDMKDN